MIQEQTDASCSAFTISAQAASKLMYGFIMNTCLDEVETLQLFYHREMAHLSGKKENSKSNVAFELVLCSVLAYAKSYQRLYQLIDDMEYVHALEEKYKNSSANKILQSFKLLAISGLGENLSTSQLKSMESSKREVLVHGSYFLQIVYLSALMSIYFDKGNREKLEENFNKAIEICEVTGYNFCKSNLLRQMACYYNKWEERIKEEICLDEEQRIASNKVAEAI